MVSTCAWLRVWRVWVEQTSCVPLLNTPGFLLIFFYVAEFQLLCSRAAHNQSLTLLIATQTETRGAAGPGDMRAGTVQRASTQQLWGRDPQMQMQVQLNQGLGIAWRSGSTDSLRMDELL